MTDRPTPKSSPTAPAAARKINGGSLNRLQKRAIWLLFLVILLIPLFMLFEAVVSLLAFYY